MIEVGHVGHIRENINLNRTLVIKPESGCFGVLG
jgi:hypothetical protein